MSDRDLFDAVARKTGEDAHEINRCGFVLTGPEDSDSNPEPECLVGIFAEVVRQECGGLSQADLGAAATPHPFRGSAPLRILPS